VLAFGDLEAIALERPCPLVLLKELTVVDVQNDAAMWR